MAMTNDNKKSLNVPPLRFPEFKGEWRNVRAIDLLETFSTNSLTWDELNYEGGAMKDVHYGLIHQRFDSVIVDANSDLIPFINSGKEPKRYTLIEEGDLILADASEDIAECGKPVEFFGKCNFPVVSGLHTIHCRDKLGITVPGFKSFLFSSVPIKRQIAHLCEGTKIYSISSGTLRELWLHVPDRKEQSKITALLEKIDERIRVQRKTIEVYKSAFSSFLSKIAQDLISSKTSLIKDLGQPFSTGNLSWEDARKGGKTPCVLYGQLFTDYSVFIENVISSTDKTEGYISNGNEIIFPSSTTVDSLSLIAPCAVLRKGILLGGDMFGIRVGSNYDPIFISAILQTKYRKVLAAKAQGSTIIHLHYDDIKNIPIETPSLAIQQEISKAIVLTSNMAANESKILASLETLKCFLLSNLFC